jgi:hypothetical protein
MDDGKQMNTIIEIINKRLIPDEQAKKARGEVFTPLNLVRELLYGLRKSEFETGKQVIWGINESGDCIDDDSQNRIGGIPLEIWRDDETKWIDPANGIGNFPFVAFHMLDFQLKHHGIKRGKEMTDEERKKHIVEKMLYMVEIDKGNVNTAFKIMDYLAPGSKANICCADTLSITDDDLMRHFGVNRFNVVMGNPPFNKPRVTRGQTATLWDKFIEYSLTKLTPKGILTFITPQLWRKPEHRIYSEFTRNRQLLYLRIIGEQETKREFSGIGSRVDVYVVENTPVYKPAYVIDEDRISHSFDTTKNPFIPNRLISEIQSFLTDKSNGIKIIHDGSYGHTDRKKVRPVKDETFQYPVIKSITQSGIEFLYTPAMKGHFGKPKVILTDSRIQYPINDYEGKYGMSDAVFGIPITSKEEGDAIVEAINSDAFKEIIKSTKWGTFRTEYHMFEYFRPDFYKQFLKKPEGGNRHSTPHKQRPSSRLTHRNKRNI